MIGPCAWLRSCCLGSWCRSWRRSCALRWTASSTSASR
jgi:hypothetical protein